MGGFLHALGAGIEGYAKERLKKSPVYRAINNGVQDYRSHHQAQPAGMPIPQPDYEDDQTGLDMYGQGKIVTSPTVAILGERGPEAVVPLGNEPNARVTPSMLGRYRPNTSTR